MQIYAPAYYYAFRCLAAACPDSCCKEWEVDVDLPTAEQYRVLPGPLGDKLRQVLRFENNGALMTITQGRCPMWREDGLCEIQAQLGHDALCRVCREFPRLRHDYGDFAELGLELSCPEVARLIFAAQPEPLTVGAAPGGEPPEYAQEEMAILRESRDRVLAFMGSSPYSASQTLAVVLLYAHGVQGQLDGGMQPVFAPEALLTAARDVVGVGDLEALFAFFRGLEILTPQWRGRLESAPISAPLPLQALALMRYALERYWLQSVSDGDLISRVKFGVTACLLVGALGGDFVQTAQLFSKEIENDPDNMNAILDAAYSSPAFTDAALLGLLLR